MLKYVLGFLAGVAGMFIGGLIGFYLFSPKTSGLLVPFMAGCAIGAARGVFIYFRNRERTEVFGSTEAPSAGKSDKINFEKMFQALDCAALGISEVRVIEREDETTGFFIGVRATDFAKVDQEQIRNLLYKNYYKHVQFELVDLNEVNRLDHSRHFHHSQLLEGQGVKINLPAQPQSPSIL
jgi:hypothetical protein